MENDDIVFYPDIWVKGLKQCLPFLLEEYVSLPLKNAQFDLEFSKIIPNEKRVVWRSFADDGKAYIASTLPINLSRKPKKIKKKVKGIALLPTRIPQLPKIYSYQELLRK